MDRALARAAVDLDVALDGPRTWGWNGRTLSRRARTTDGRSVWLRLLAAPAERAHGKLWDGNATAQEALGDLDGRRPALLRRRDDHDGATAYRTEMTEHVPEPVYSVDPVLRHPLHPTDTWWTNLRRALDTVAATPTDRVAVRREWIDRAVPKYLHVPAPNPTIWTTAHGDLHWANLTAHGPKIFDWEGWGIAPAGYDAAMLHTYSLAEPDVAARVRGHFPILDTPDGLLAETIVVTELLQGLVERGDNRAVEIPLLHRADALRTRLIRENV